MKPTVKQYNTKPCSVYALPWTGDNADQVRQWISASGGTAGYDPETHSIAIETLEGTMKADVGDFIIQLAGEFYPCKPEIFHKKYEENR